MDVVIFLAVAVVVCWVLIKLGSYWYASRTRTLDSLGLDQTLRGLLLFGRPGAYLALVEVNGGDRIVLQKALEHGAEVLQFEVSGPNATESAAMQIVSLLSAAGERLQWAREWDSPRSVHRGHLTGRGIEDEGILESMIRMAAHELGHEPGSHYKVEFEGPADYDEVSRYYGWKSRKLGSAKKE